MRAQRALAGLALFAMMVAAPFQAAAQSADAAWIHVQVIEEGEDGETVSVNLPLSLARVALQVAPDKLTEKLTSKFNEEDIKIADLRALWAEVKRTGDAEFVSIESGEESVSVSRVGDLIKVFVEERGGDDGDEAGERVQVDIPIVVVDALLSGEGEELNLEAAVARLGERRGDIVQVRDGSSRVRVWIDERS